MKRLLFIFTAFLIVVFVPFAVGEIVTRALLGKRLLFEEIRQDGFYRFKPNQKGWYLYNTRAPATINNISARGDSVDLKLFPQINQYFFFGDSFTFGYALKDGETLPHYFMKKGGLSPNHVINFGNSAFGTYHMMQTYDYYQKWIQPGDTVVMVMIEDDFYRVLDGYQSTPLKDFLWKIRAHSSFFAWLVTSVQKVVAQGRVGEFLVKIKQEDQAARERVIAYSRKKEIFSEEGALLLDFHQKVKATGQTLLYVFYENQSSDYSKKAEEFCKKNGLHCVTEIYRWLEPLHEKGIPTVCDYDHTHPSPEANAVVAEKLLTFLSD